MNFSVCNASMDCKLLVKTIKKHNIFGDQPQMKTADGANDKNSSNQPTPAFMEMMSQFGGAPAT